MRKVKEPTINNGKYSHVVIKQTFPSNGCSAMQNKLAGKKPSNTALKDMKELNAQYKNLLKMNGLYDEDIAEYENSFTNEKNEYNQARNDGMVNICIFLP